MSVYMKMVNKTEEPSYPRLLQWTPSPRQSLIVLFTSERTGVALSGADEGSIGRESSWVAATDKRWAPCSIVLTDEAC